MNYKIFPATTFQDGHKIQKVPIKGIQWQQDATNNPNQIQQWQNHHGPHLKIWGVPTGPDNGILVLDVDVKDVNENGFTTLTQMPQLPVTKIQNTPSGGRHYLFKYPTNGQNYGNRVKFMPGLDIRGAGGWIAYYGTDETEVAEAPQWVLDAASQQEYDHQGTSVKVSPAIAAEIMDSALDNIRNAPPGESNNVLNIEAFRVGQIVKSGSIDIDYAKEALFRAAKERGKPDYEARATIKSGIEGGDKKPLTSPFGDAEPIPQVEIPPPPGPRERWTPDRFTKHDLLSTQNLRKPQLFKDWSTEDIHITTADGGTGKTTLKLYEAICLALGDPFLGFQCMQKGKTLFITGEDTKKKLGAMLGAIIRQMGLFEEAIGNDEKIRTILDSIVVKKDSDLCLISKTREGFLLPNGDAMTKMYEAVDDIKPKMIVFDPISSFWGSESALNDMNKAVSKFMSQLAEHSGACVEMINHMGKASSSSKDMGQFAGRGGSGLPSHSRVSRTMRPIDEEEFKDMTGDELLPNQTAILCNINKFSDGSSLFNKPFLITRNGYLFSRKNLAEGKAREVEKQLTDIERVFAFVKEARQLHRYPTKDIITAYMQNSADKLSKDRVKYALNLLEFSGRMGEFLKPIENPDQSNPGKVYIIIDADGNEV